MKKRVYICLLSAAGCVAIFAAAKVCLSKPKPETQPKVEIRTGQTAHKFSAKVDLAVHGNYLLFLPETYGKDKKRWPLILYLHGSGERGSDFNRLKKLGLPKKVEQDPKFPFIVLSPQCPAGRFWSDIDVTLMVIAMLGEVCKKYQVDKDRIYLTGLSMGGHGTWWLAQQFPNQWAAIAPICGWGNPYLAQRLKNIPAQVYHGGKDRNVPIGLAKMMVSTLESAGGQVEMVVYPNEGHVIWERAYADPKLYQWLLKHKLGQKPARPKKKPQPKRPASAPAPKQK
jgi:predicted peptidase